MIIALLDANILYSAPMRDIFMQLAEDDLYQARWTTDIQRELITAVLRNKPNRDPAALDRTRDLMNTTIRDALVPNYELLIDSLKLPDENDRHVLAAAITGACNVIITQNLSDFPAAALSPYNIVAQHPDIFLVNLLRAEPAEFCKTVRKIRTRLKNPPVSVATYLATLTRQGLVATGSELMQFSELL